MQIIGAGLAGLLAGNMLRHHNPVIFEQQQSLPNNHSAVLRFRSSIVGDTLNIPFKKVRMIKCAVPWKNPVADALAYSRKNTGVMHSDRSITAGLVSDERFIAPQDLIPRMAEGLTIHYGNPFVFGQDKYDGPIISTLPLPVLAKLLNYPIEIKTTSTPAVHIWAMLADCDAYVSLVVPDPASEITRISITGANLIIETNRRDIPQDLEEKFAWLDFIAKQVSMMLGTSIMDTGPLMPKLSQYAKINPIDDKIRKDFIHWATDKHNIFSLGRFATWRPKLLMDDLVQDIRLIDRWVRDGSYNIQRHRT